MRHFVRVCRRRSLKVNAGKSKVMILIGEEGLGCEVYVDGIHLQHFLEFIYLGCVLNDKSSADEAGCNGRRVAGAIRFLINARDL